jgi:CubicO group peptidase (beta-lactamase class C family)
MKKIIACVFAIVILGVSNLLAQDITGTWNGAIKIPGQELEIIIEFRNENDTLKGDIDIPQQGAKDMILTEISCTALKVLFKFPDAPGNVSFAGTFNPEVDSITGDFMQAGNTVPFYLKRESKDDAAAKKAKLEEKLLRFEALIDTFLVKLNVPGLAVGIVKDDEIILSKGFGKRNIEKDLPATENTLYAIGSTTKAFTAVILGTLVDDGDLDWEEPVKTYLPTFKMHNHFATEEMTAIDLLTHRSGLPRHDLMWYGSPFSRKEIFDRLQYLEPTASFRTTFQYQNIMYMTAGYLAGQIKETTWEALLKDRIIEPLKMESTTVSLPGMQASRDYAMPYRADVDNEELVEMKFRNIEQIGPAGSINSNVVDMLKWVQLHLNNGKVGKREILSKAQMKKMHQSHMTTGRGPGKSGFGETNYALGWMTTAYKGHTVLQHGGNIDGFTAMMHLLPQDDLGVVILANKNAASINSILALYATELFLDMEETDWYAKIFGDDEEEDNESKEEEENNRIEGTKPAHGNSTYAGKYEHKAYGVITVKEEGKKLKLHFNSFDLDLDHWHYETFNATGEDLGGQEMKFNFFTNKDGKVESLSVTMELSLDDIVFEKLPPAVMEDTVYIAKLIGKYDFDGQKMEVKLDNGKLMADFAGKLHTELIPYDKNEFKLEALNGFVLEFILDKKGKVTGAKSHQPDGTYTAKRVD